MKKLLKDADPAVRLRAMGALAEFGKPAVPFLIEALGDPDACQWACLILSEIGPDAADAVPALIKVIEVDRPDIRREAILALAKIGPGAVQAVPRLTKELDSDAPGIPLAAAFALGSIGPDAKEAVAKLKKLAGSDDPLTQTVVAWALARLQPNDQEARIAAAKRLIESLKSDDAGVRVAAARALAALKPEPGEFAPYFLEILGNQDEAVLSRALDALATLGTEAIPGLIKALSIEKAQKPAAYILGKIGPAAKKAVPALIKAAGCDDPETRREVFFALGKMGPAAKKAVPVLAKALDDPCEECRFAAIFALGKIGSAAKPAEKGLLEHLGGDDEFAATISAWALAQIDPTCTEAAAKSVPLLVKALEDPNPQIREEAAVALKCLGPLAKSAVPTLEKASTGDKDAHVRKTAAAALKAVQGK